MGTHEQFASRLREAMAVRGLKQVDLCEKTDIPKSALSQYLNGRFEPKQDRLWKLASVLSVSEAWLMGYDVPMDPNSQPSVPPGFQPMPAMTMLPIVGRIACGEPILAEENIEGETAAPESWRATFCLVCEGDSMLPRIQDGDLVAIRKQFEVENGEIAAVRIDGEATLKHVYLYPNYIELRPENPAFESIIKIGEEMNEVVIEGKAVGLCRAI